MNDDSDDEDVFIRPEDLGEPGATVLGPNASDESSDE